MEEKGDEIVGYFFNPNIHPYQEYQKRLESLAEYSQTVGLKVIYRDEYLLEDFLRNVSHSPGERCSYCYHVRLESAAREAKANFFDGFSTEWLPAWSRHMWGSLEDISQGIAGKAFRDMGFGAWGIRMQARRVARIQ
jgi:predicted adenine nucleotide alpha hydrolase (AANH) superfamily ATPase